MALSASSILEAEKAFATRQSIDPAALNALHALRVQQEEKLPDDAHKMAAWVVAPALAGFAMFMAQQGGQGQFLGVMREGRLLCRLMEKLFGVPTRKVWLNRNISMLAAFGCGDDEALMNWLVRTRNKAITLGQATLQLTGKSSGGDALIDLTAAQDLMSDTNFVKDARAKSAVLADRLVRHWQNVARPDNANYLMDFACAGNIQRSLQTVLNAREIKSVVVGLNFSMTSGAKWAEEKGCVMKGYLSQKGQPAWFAQAYAKTPELMEVFAAAPLGPLQDYTETGSPIYGTSFLSLEQHTLVESMQSHILEAASLYQRQLRGDLTDDIVRCVWGRFLQQPLPEEIAAFAEWPLDAGLDGSAQRKLAAQGAWTKR